MLSAPAQALSAKLAKAVRARPLALLNALSEALRVAYQGWGATGCAHIVGSGFASIFCRWWRLPNAWDVVQRSGCAPSSEPASRKRSSPPLSNSVRQAPAGRLCQENAQLDESLPLRSESLVEDSRGL